MNTKNLLRHPASYPRAVLITGAARRIGRALALDFAAQGWVVAAHYNRSSAQVESLLEDIAAGGGKAVALQADLQVEADVQNLVPRAVEQIGPLGCLINNASRFESDSLTSVTRQSWDRHIEPNLRAPLVLIQSFARVLEEADSRDAEGSAPRGGVVINLLDQRVLNPQPGFMSYAVSKAGLWALTQSLALELAPRIRINGIGPGPALANSMQSEAEFAAQCAAMPLGAGTSPQEICVAARFLMAARSVTGQMIALDGGEHLGWALPARNHGVPD